jgi:hypothetical protein
VFESETSEISLLSAFDSGEVCNQRPSTNIKKTITFDRMDRQQNKKFTISKQFIDTVRESAVWTGR